MEMLMFDVETAVQSHAKRAEMSRRMELWECEAQDWRLCSVSKPAVWALSVPGTDFDVKEAMGV